MNKKALDILADAISDAGAWQWWHLEKDMLQLEFCGVQLYDESKPEKDIHTTDVIAVRFFGNVFAVFLDDLDDNEDKPWYERFYDDEIPAFECDGYSLAFDDPEYAQEVYDAYGNRTPVTAFDGMKTLTDAKHLIAAKCGNAGVIAGGDRALRHAVENAEDIAEQGWKDLLPFSPTPNDSVIGIAASGTTPYVVGAIRQARSFGLTTGCITSNPQTPLAAAAEFPVETIVGPEFVTGSSRMKSGTAQKMVLNMISTTLMIRLGRVQGNRMVNMQLTNAKLIDRGTKMIQDSLGLSYDEARKRLLEAGSVSGVL